MKRFIEKYGKIFAAIAFMFTTYNSNSTCMYIIHQPELPKEAKRLRRF